MESGYLNWLCADPKGGSSCRIEIHASLVARCWACLQLAGRWRLCQPIYNWRRQAQIDHGLEPGSTSVEQAELRAVRRQIVKLETELTDQHWQIIDQNLE